MKFIIVSADRIIDGKGDHSQTDKLFNRNKKMGFASSVLEIVNLAKRWEDKLGPNQFKSGASAMAAVNKARKILQNEQSSIVMIKGVDLLRTGYAREDREKFMKLYENRYTPLDGYTKLVRPFLKHHKITEKEFFKIRDALFENYAKTWNKKLPDARWFEPLTKYFRGVDCANPNIDYSGQLIITNEKHADVLKIPKNQRIEILSNAFTKLKVDGYESIPFIASYNHLRRVFNKAIKEAQIDFKSEYLNGTALLEVYTCYPIVPMALLLKSGLVKNAVEIPDFLKDHEVTITGGLNLDRAAWNLTSLNYLITMREKLINNKNYKYGLVHGNGSLGNQQGITIIGKL